MAVEGTRRAENWATISGDRATPANRKCQAPRFPPERNPINPRPTGTRRANFWFYPRRVHFLSRFTAFRSSFTGFRLGSTGYLFLTKPHRDRLEYKEQQKQKFSLKKQRPRKGNRPVDRSPHPAAGTRRRSAVGSTSVSRWPFAPVRRPGPRPARAPSCRLGAVDRAAPSSVPDWFQKKK